MKALIVHAHHEPRSFSSALAQQAAVTLRDAGHEVMFSDLYGESFDPVSDRRNFTSVKNPNYLKQQTEELEATAAGGFAPALEAEIRKLESCDLLVFSFPLWWFGMPAILKGWVDRVFPMGRIYGGGKLYENALGQARKRAMLLMTTGGNADSYSGFGIHTPADELLAPIHHGIFWFNGFLALDPFIVWSAARITQEERADHLQRLDTRLRSLETERPCRLPPLADFPGFGKDTRKRFMVSITQSCPPTGCYSERVADLKRDGIILATFTGAPVADHWQDFLVLREDSAEDVRHQLSTLPLATDHNAGITELMQV